MIIIGKYRYFLIKSIIKLSFFLLFSFILNSSFAKPSKDISAEFTHLANEYERSLFEYAPELGLFWGRTNVAQDRFMDYSTEATIKWQQKEDEFLTALNQMDESLLRETPHYYTFLLLKESLEDKKNSRVCKEELWDINPAWGWHNKMAIIAEKQPIGSEENRQLALKRWRTFDTVVEEQIRNLKLGISLGYTAPQSAVRRVLTQLKIILESPLETSPFFDFAKRDDDTAFKLQVADLIESTINPSLKKYIHYLESEYLPIARKHSGVWSLPLGAQCYQSKIKQETTLSLTPTEIHDMGLKAIAKVSDEIAEIGLEKYGIKDIRLIFSKAKDESNHYFSSEEDIIHYNLLALHRVNQIVGQWFNHMPKTEGIIKPYPLHRAKTGASGEYSPPSEDGKEAGIYFINTFEPEKRSRIDMEATLFHELIPGHHFQVALNYENTTLLSLNKYLWNAGYGEGWAFYVERLADEMGLYNDPISRLGMLSNESLRAARLVVDTGLHAFHWTREDAIEYLTKHTALDKYIIEGEVDRYIMLPAQATSYMIGKQEIEHLRQLASDKLGEEFNIRQFHDQILNHGVISLAILRDIIEKWILEKKVSNNDISS